MSRFVIVFVLAVCACRHAPAPAVSPREQKREPKPRTAVLTPDVALERIAASYLGGMQRCYRSRLKHDARAGGRVVVTFTVDERGKLAAKQARGVGRALENCVERAMARWSFPPPAEETTFRLTFRLSSRT